MDALVEAQSLSVPYSNGLGSTWGLKATNVLSDASRRWTGRGIRIAILDSGVDLAHPELEARIVEARIVRAGMLAAG